jgi:hypothetical protein
VSERVPLDQILISKKDGQELLADWDHPMPVMYQDSLWKCTAILERTAVIMSVTDNYERFTVRHENILVDPINVQWTDAKTPETFKTRMRAHTPRDPKTRAKVRELTDKRAEKDQAVKKQPKGTNSLKQIPAEFSAWDREASQRGRRNALAAREAAAPTQSETVAPNAIDSAPPKETSMTEVLKHCPGCKKDKPKSEFPAGKGFFYCNECRSKHAVPMAAAATVETRAGAIVKTAGGMKRCPHCKKEKPLDAFGLHKKKADGRQSVCRECRSEIWTAGSTAMAHKRDAQVGNPGSQFKVIVDNLKKLIADLRAENTRLKSDLAEVNSQLEGLLAS